MMMIIIIIIIIVIIIIACLHHCIFLRAYHEFMCTVSAMEQLFVERVCHLTSLPESLMTPGYLGEGAVPHTMHVHKMFRFQPERAHHDIHFDLSVDAKVFRFLLV